MYVPGPVGNRSGRLGRPPRGRHMRVQRRIDRGTPARCKRSGYHCLGMLCTGRGHGMRLIHNLARRQEDGAGRVGETVQTAHVLFVINCSVEEAITKLKECRGR